MTSSSTEFNSHELDESREGLLQLLSDVDRSSSPRKAVEAVGDWCAARLALD